jgi:hypothetical protein
MTVREAVSCDASMVGEWEAMTLRQLGDTASLGRLRLMGRHLAKAMESDPNEDRFLSLWTMLEVWPMAGTSNIQPLRDRLADHLGRDPGETKEKLQLGRLVDLRGKLLHDGEMGLSNEQMNQTLARLQDICVECMRALSGLPYAGALDKFFSTP